jgi:uncharacterized protein (DUF1778 family)
MTTNSEPTMGEVLRRLDEVSRQLLDLAAQMREDRDKAFTTFVQQAVYNEREKTYAAQRLADQAVVADLHGDLKTVETNLVRDVEAIRKARESDTGFRRQVWLTLGALAITTLVTIVIAIFNFVAK